jgi:hypothetical protein
MAERRLVILKRSGKTPVLGMCEKCQIKFFTPRRLTTGHQRPKKTSRKDSISTYAENEIRKPG